MLTFNNDALRASVNKSEAIKEYERNKEKFVFKNTDEFKKYLDKRHAFFL